MRRVFKNGKVRKHCKIYVMLSAHAHGKHISFHTPGHKRKGWDITELSYSDNLSCPHGCIAEAERDIATLLGAEKSFILTDGSTSGVLAMLHAAKSLGVKRVAVCEGSHKSVFNGCALLGLTPLVYPQKKRVKIPFLPSMYALNEEFPEIFFTADALFFTSPDYYGNIAELKEIRRYCDEHNKLLLVDGAHGGHLHFEKEIYAGAYADMWVDGVHKSLPALTQGAVVSARDRKTAEVLGKAVDIFRTTSPSYPIMASVEYAVKYPRNEGLEREATEFETTHPRIYFGGDWTKLCAVFGNSAFAVEKELEKAGIYAEFCDGNVVAFYLSPITRVRDFRALKKGLSALFEKYPADITQDEPPVFREKRGETEWVEIALAKGRVCARVCGLFPPCTPLIAVGEEITEDKIRLLLEANNVFGAYENKILVFKNEEKE